MRPQAGTSRPTSRAALLAAAVGCALLLALAGRGAANSAGRRYSGDDAPENGPNPCTGPERQQLLCPNLRMSRPSHLFISISPSGRRLLHAQSSLNSRGQGPIELRGIRIPGTNLMRVNQRIHRRGGGKLVIQTQGRLAFYPVPGQYRYWKFRDAARFEIWTVDRQHDPKRQIRTGPKFYYCLRDLERTNPSGHSPHHRVYPGCNQNPNQRGVTLGTSVGWSDIYPADYHEQYVNVSGLRGCYAFYMEADPKNHLRESNENDNRSRTLVRLPSGHAGC
jgi:hypothetical protein